MCKTSKHLKVWTLIASLQQCSLLWLVCFSGLSHRIRTRRLVTKMLAVIKISKHLLRRLCGSKQHHNRQHVSLTDVTVTTPSFVQGPVWGRGTPLPPCPFTSSSFPLFTFPFLSLALPVFFFCPSLPFLPE